MYANNVRGCKYTNNVRVRKYANNVRLSASLYWFTVNSGIPHLYAGFIPRFITEFTEIELFWGVRVRKKAKFLRFFENLNEVYR